VKVQIRTLEEHGETYIEHMMPRDFAVGFVAAILAREPNARVQFEMFSHPTEGRVLDGVTLFRNRRAP
jgi:hypothetical protein